MCMSGLVYFRIQERPFTTDLFGSFLDELVQILAEKGMEGMSIVMDNVAFHKSHIIQEKFTNSTHTLIFMTPCTPFLNPIENLISKWKHIVCIGAPTTPEALKAQIYSAADLITPNDCLGFFGHLHTYFSLSLRMEPINN
jgi:hypothetical protein